MLLYLREGSQTKQQTRMHKAVAVRIEARKLLSRRSREKQQTGIKCHKCHKNWFILMQPKNMGNWGGTEAERHCEELQKAGRDSHSVPSPIGMYSTLKFEAQVLKIP